MGGVLRNVTIGDSEDRIRLVFACSRTFRASTQILSGIRHSRTSRFCLRMLHSLNCAQLDSDGNHTSPKRKRGFWLLPPR